MPPSPAPPRFLLGKKLKQAMSPHVPAERLSHDFEEDLDEAIREAPDDLALDALLVYPRDTCREPVPRRKKTRPVP